MSGDSSSSYFLPRAGVDKAAINVCSAAGIDLMSRRRVRLLQLRKSLEVSVAEIQKQAEWDGVMSKALLAANIVKATCEAFLEMAGALGDAAGIKGAGEVAKAGTSAMAWTDSAQSLAIGQRTDHIGNLNKIAGQAISTRMKEGPMQDFAELQSIKVDIINNAIRGDSAKALQSVFLSYIPKIGAMSLDYMKKDTAAKWTSAVSSVASAGYSYSAALEEAFNNRIDDTVEIAERKNMLLATTHRQIGQVTQQITLIDQIMDACASAIPKGRLA
ncbi:MAG: hypothetical protein R3D83_04040 [Caenibius sp.]